MVDVLVIPDGAAQPPRAGTPTSLELASTPALDALAADGAVHRVATTPPGLAPGSETCIPSLLGFSPREPVGRARVDAAGYGISIPAGLVPWRADVLHADGTRASEREARTVAALLGAAAVHVRGHRLLLAARNRPGDCAVGGLRLRVWDDGAVPAGNLNRATTMIAAPGAAAGCARLLGAEVVVPAGATGDVDTDLRSKGRAALDRVAGGSERIVVHAGGADEAAHRGDSTEVARFLERLDQEILAPLSDLLERIGGRLTVCPDHGTDPSTGAHVADPVPAVAWGAGITPSGPDVMTERAVAAVEPGAPTWIAPLAVTA